MQVGDLVRIKDTKEYPWLKNKLAIVVVNGTWSADVHVISLGSSWKPRIAKEKLEVINESR